MENKILIGIFNFLKRFAVKIGLGVIITLVVGVLAYLFTPILDPFIPNPVKVYPSEIEVSCNNFTQYFDVTVQNTLNRPVYGVALASTIKSQNYSTEDWDVHTASRYNNENHGLTIGTNVIELKILEKDTRFPYIEDYIHTMQPQENIPFDVIFNKYECNGTAKIIFSIDLYSLTQGSGVLVQNG